MLRLSSLTILLALLNVQVANAQTVELVTLTDDHDHVFQKNLLTDMAAAVAATVMADIRTMT